MIGKKPILLLLALSFSAIAQAQISPGPLCSGHSQLEGIENCTMCHTVGKLISNTKCLSCHEEIASRINQHIGYHPTVSSEPCTKCHLDHLGRTFQITRFDTLSFDHSTAGFVLKGKHKIISCRGCHNPNEIFARDVKILPAVERKTTFLGLSTNCEACHEDIHKGQFTQSCSACHGMAHWIPADNFNHDRTSYPLTGKHKNVGCYECHNGKLADNKTIKFIEMRFSSCDNCHSDPHSGQFKRPCSSCHTTESFKTVRRAEFDHSDTSFPLLGKHAEVKCEQCHQSDPERKNVTGGLGFHITKFQLCSDCHADAHAGQFVDRPDKGKCESCHSIEGWIPASYTIADHQKDKFALDGAHLAVPCYDCHIENKVKAASTRQFRWIGRMECSTCHSDIHKGQFNLEMINGCSTCHVTDSWVSLPAFSHDKTKFPLRGAHAMVACDRCHVKTANLSTPVKFVDLSTVCSSCHSDQHQGQFQVEGATDCARCHTVEDWHNLIFDHNTQSAFGLTGKHVDVPCAKCHPSVVENGKKTVRYKPLGTQCTDCHSTTG